MLLLKAYLPQTLLPDSYLLLGIIICLDFNNNKIKRHAKKARETNILKKQRHHWKHLNVTHMLELNGRGFKITLISPHQTKMQK